MRIFLSIWMVITISVAAHAGDQPHFKKAFMVIFENTNYAEAAALPFFGKLAKGGVSFTQFMAEAHPSQPNYIAMISGSTQGVFSDGPVQLGGANLADLIEKAGKTWKMYAEDYPGNCFQGTTSKNYGRKHNPFISFKNIVSQPERCARIVNATELDTDIANGTLPDFSFYAPNVKNDGHDTGAAFADQWLAKTFGPRLLDQKFAQDLLFIATFDESEDYMGPNQIFTAFYGDSVQPGSTVTDRVNHYSILKTVEAGLGLGSLSQEDSRAPAILGIWK